MRVGLSKVEWFLESYRWELHSRFLDLVEPHLESTLREWEQAIEQQAQEIDDEDERAEFYEFHSDEYRERLEFKSILMNSFFSASFALFENQLIAICQSAQRDSASRFSVKDIGSYSPTDRVKTYLQKLGVLFPSDGPEWQEITKYQKIRNKIMHEGGELPPNSDVTTFAKSKQIVSTRAGSPRLELTRPFCDVALEDMRRFLLEVHKAYGEWLKANK